MTATSWNVTNEEYHADTTKIGSSMLRTVLDDPAEYHARYVVKTTEREETRSMLLGSVTGTLILEPEAFDSLYWVRPEGINGRTKKGKEALAELALKAIGKQELKIDLYEQAKAMAASVLSIDFIREMIDASTKEEAVVWQGDASGLVFKLKTDLFIPRPEMPSDLVLDIKTSDNPRPENWDRHSQYAPIQKYRYDLQGAHYSTGKSIQTGRPCSFGLIVVGSGGTHPVWAYDLTKWLPIGAMWRRNAIREITRCMESGVWRRESQGGVIDLEPSDFDEPGNEAR